jgi:hypothetical protein
MPTIIIIGTFLSEGWSMSSFIIRSSIGDITYLMHFDKNPTS